MNRLKLLPTWLKVWMIGSVCAIIVLTFAFYEGLMFIIGLGILCIIIGAIAGDFIAYCFLNALIIANFVFILFPFDKQGNMNDGSALSFFTTLGVVFIIPFVISWIIATVVLIYHRTHRNKISNEISSTVENVNNINNSSKHTGWGKPIKIIIIVLVVLIVIILLERLVKPVLDILNSR